MENKILSIAIGEYKTKICVTNYKKKHPQIYQTLLFDTPVGCIEDGFIMDKDTLAETILYQLKAANIGIMDVVFTITSSKIATHEITIPMVREKEIKEYVNAGASDYFPINVLEYAISYSILEKLQTKQNRSYRLLVIAVHNSMLLSYFELAGILKLNIVSIDYLSNSILQMLQKQINPKETIMFVHMNEKSTLFNILSNGVLKLQRTIAYGSEAPVEVVMNNMFRVIEYYSSKNPDNPLQTMYLSGICTRWENSKELFENEFGLQVIILNELSGINFKQAMLPGGCLQSDFLDCIGATLAPVGMVPREYTNKVEKKSYRKEIIEICALAFVTSIVLVVVSSINVTNAKKERERLQKSIEDMEKVEGIYIKNSELTQKLELMKSIDESCNSNTENLNYLLSELEAKLPKSILIRSFRANETEVIMDVCIDSKEAAAMTFIQLESISLLTDIKTEKITEETDEYGVTKLNYIITAKYAA